MSLYEMTKEQLEKNQEVLKNHIGGVSIQKDSFINYVKGQIKILSDELDTMSVEEAESMAILPF